MGFARHFIEDHYKKGVRRSGLSIDLRREFTTDDERYSKFIAREFDADVEVYAEDGDPVDPAGKAERAEPFRPAIHLEQSATGT